LVRNYHSLLLKIPKQCRSHIVAEAWNHASGIPIAQDLTQNAVHQVRIMAI